MILNNSEINGYFNYFYDTNTSLLTDKENKNKKGIITFKCIPLYEQIKKVLIIYISLPYCFDFFLRPFLNLFTREIAHLNIPDNYRAMIS